LRWDHFRKWFRRHTRRTERLETVFLWDDCFTTYTEPEIGVAAVTLIEAAGYRVELAEPICCGRPLISKGYLTQARHLIERQATMLYHRLKNGTPLLGL